MLRDELPPVLGEAPNFMDFMERVSRVARIDRPVLVLGERGTGKELVASRLHFLSPRWNGPFVRLNAAAFPQTLLESELFGHEAGAFTGAIKSRPGRFEQADEGTLFLDEIALAGRTVQEQLLRIVEYGRFERLGSNQTIQTDVRLLAATNADLPALADKGDFRWDLLDRLSFEVLRIPPLRDRQGDILLLADHFARQMAHELDLPRFKGFSPQAKDQLQAHDWPGNVRELRNTTERAVARWEDHDEPVGEVDIDPFDRQPTNSASPAKGGFRAQLNQLERQLLNDALAKTHHNQRQAAELLELNYDQLRHALKRHHLLPPKT